MTKKACILFCFNFKGYNVSYILCKFEILSLSSFFVNDILFVFFLLTFPSFNTNCKLQRLQIKMSTKKDITVKALIFWAFFKLPISYNILGIIFKIFNEFLNQ